MPSTEIPEFLFPRRLIRERRASARVGELLSSCAGDRAALIVADRVVYETGLAVDLQVGLERAGIQVSVFSDVAGSRSRTWCFKLSLPDAVRAPASLWGSAVDLDMAIKVANASEYGLSASLFTRGLASAEQFLRDIEAGQAAVNLPTSGWDVHHPFGGFKLSGSPFKEQGLEALHFYTRVKTCAVRAM